MKAAAGIADDKFNANLMLAKIGDVNFGLERTSEALAAYSRMVVKKPESAAQKLVDVLVGLARSLAVFRLATFRLLRRRVR